MRTYIHVFHIIQRRIEGITECNRVTKLAQEHIVMKNRSRNNLTGATFNRLNNILMQLKIASEEIMNHMKIKAAYDQK